jgi:hypothetical protein
LLTFIDCFSENYFPLHFICEELKQLELLKLIGFDHVLEGDYIACLMSELDSVVTVEGFELCNTEMLESHHLEQILSQNETINQLLIYNCPYIEKADIDEYLSENEHMVEFFYYAGTDWNNNCETEHYPEQFYKHSLNDDNESLPTMLLVFSR